MKALLPSICFFFLVLNLSAQPPKVTGTNTYKFAGVQYKVPKFLFSDPFGSYLPEEWNEHGSSVCACTGIIHLNDDRDFKMVFYPSSLDSLESRRHNMIWDHQFVRAAEAKTVTTEYATFQLEVSTFAGEEEYVVHRYKTMLGGYGYLIYFFGEAEVMAAYASSIETVIGSFREGRRMALRVR